MKKLLALLLALAMVFGLLGCEAAVDLALDIAEEVLVDSTDYATDESVPDQTEEDSIQDQTDDLTDMDPPEDTTVANNPEDTTVADDLEDTTAASPAIDEEGFYYSAEEVALYLHTYGHLPENFITKSEARKLGWEGGNVEKYAPDCAIGGDKFGNREELLPVASGRQYYECDIDTHGEKSRGAKRIVFSNDGLIYYTDDHYESFVLLYGEE